VGTTSCTIRVDQLDKLKQKAHDMGLNISELVRTLIDNFINNRLILDGERHELHLGSIDYKTHKTLRFRLVKQLISIGLTQREIAEHLGLDESTISRDVKTLGLNEEVISSRVCKDIDRIHDERLGILRQQNKELKGRNKKLERKLTYQRERNRKRPVLRYQYNQLQRKHKDDQKANQRLRCRIQALRKELSLRDEFIAPIEELDLNLRTYNSLRRAGITCIGQILALIEYDMDRLVSIRNMGNKSLGDLVDRLCDQGYIAEDLAQRYNYQVQAITRQ